MPRQRCSGRRRFVLLIDRLAFCGHRLAIGAGSWAFVLLRTIGEKPLGELRAGDGAVIGRTRRCRRRCRRLALGRCLAVGRWLIASRCLAIGRCRCRLRGSVGWCLGRCARLGRIDQTADHVVQGLAVCPSGVATACKHHEKAKAENHARIVALRLFLRRIGGGRNASAGKAAVEIIAGRLVGAIVCAAIIADQFFEIVPGRAFLVVLLGACRKRIFICTGEGWRRLRRQIESAVS